MIQGERYHIPTLGEVETKLAGKKIFTEVDMSSAFGMSISEINRPILMHISYALGL